MSSPSKAKEAFGSLRRIASSPSSKVARGKVDGATARGRGGIWDSLFNLDVSFEALKRRR